MCPCGQSTFALNEQMVDGVESEIKTYFQWRGVAVNWKAPSKGTASSRQPQRPCLFAFHLEPQPQCANSSEGCWIVGGPSVFAVTAYVLCTHDASFQTELCACACVCVRVCVYSLKSGKCGAAKAHTRSCPLNANRRLLVDVCFYTLCAGYYDLITIYVRAYDA